MSTKLIVLVLAAAFTGCATRAVTTTPTTTTRFYLVPDPTGHVGEVTISTHAGSVDLDQSGHSTDLSHADLRPTAPRTAGEGEIERAFGAALAVLPKPPQAFLLHFAFGSSSLEPDVERELDQVVDTITERDSRDVSINGHTDLAGEDELNVRLSLARAEAVRVALVERGVPAESLSIQYFGKSKPLVPTPDGKSEPANRRVEIVIR